MLTCKKAVKLMSRELDHDLGLAERLSLWFHVMMCRDCRNCRKQMNFLQAACRQFPASADQGDFTDTGERR